jgi:glutathione peroxidase
MRLIIVLLLSAFSMLASAQDAKTCAAMFNTDMRLLHSEKTVNLCDIVKGRPVLVVNTASHCGFTPQLKGLEKLHQTYKDKGLVVIGFTSDDFYQEAETESEAAKICYVNFGVSFTMLAPSHVKGDKANKVFAAINKQSKAPSWNFNKYLVDANGVVVEHFGSNVKPEDIKLSAAIDALLQLPKK